MTIDAIEPMHVYDCKVKSTVLLHDIVLRRRPNANRIITNNSIKLHFRPTVVMQASAAKSRQAGVWEFVEEILQSNLEPAKVSDRKDY